VTRAVDWWPGVDNEPGTEVQADGLPSLLAAECGAGLEDLITGLIPRELAWGASRACIHRCDEDFSIWYEVTIRDGEELLRVAWFTTVPVPEPEPPDMVAFVEARLRAWPI